MLLSDADVHAQNLTALSLFGISRGVDVDLALLEPCQRLTELTLRSCRNVSCIPQLPLLAVLKWAPCVCRSMDEAKLHLACSTAIVQLTACLRAMDAVL